MKPVLFLQNIPIETPGTMERFLEERNISWEIRDLYSSESVPSDLTHYGAIVVLGGPMNVDEEDQYPFLAQEKVFLKRGIEMDIPILGICLGGQLLASALGAQVVKCEQMEIGWKEVEFTEAGEENVLLTGLSNPLSVFQWHGDTFQMPEGALHLAHSSDCRNQAFSWKDKYFGLQFHVEVTERMASAWARAYYEETPMEERIILKNLIENEERDKSMKVNHLADRLFHNFFCSVAGYPQSIEE